MMADNTKQLLNGYKVLKLILFFTYCCWRRNSNPRPYEKTYALPVQQPELPCLSRLLVSLIITTLSC